MYRTKAAIEDGNADGAIFEPVPRQQAISLGL